MSRLPRDSGLVYAVSRVRASVPSKVHPSLAARQEDVPMLPRGGALIVKRNSAHFYSQTNGTRVCDAFWKKHLRDSLARLEQLYRAFYLVT